jgi:hypothetical protein
MSDETTCPVCHHAAHEPGDCDHGYSPHPRPGMPDGMREDATGSGCTCGQREERKMSDETIHLDRRTDEGPPMAAACGAWARRETRDRSAVTCPRCLAAPLCACDAVLPLGHPKSVITCPGCGAKSLPREAAQESAPRLGIYGTEREKQRIANAMMTAAEQLDERSQAIPIAVASAMPRRTWGGVDEETGEPVGHTFSVDAETWNCGPLVRVTVRSGSVWAQAWLRADVAAEAGRALVAAGSPGADPLAAAHAAGVAEELARWEALLANWKHAAEGYQRGADNEGMPDMLRHTDAARADVYRTVVDAAERLAAKP